MYKKQNTSALTAAFVGISNANHARCAFKHQSSAPLALSCSAPISCHPNASLCLSMKQPCSARCNQLSLRAPAFRVVKVVMSSEKVSSKISTSTSNLLQLHFLRELLVELTQLLDQVLASVDDCFLWCDLAVCLNSKLESGEEWVRDLVAGEEDVVCFGELCAKEVAECVVFLVECEHRGIGDACEVSIRRATE